MRNVTKIVFIGFSLLAGAATVPAAAAEMRSASEIRGYNEAVRSASEARRLGVPQTVVEGRNIASPAPAPRGVEPYIARQIELNARSQR